MTRLLIAAAACLLASCSAPDSVTQDLPTAALVSRSDALALRDGWQTNERLVRDQSVGGELSHRAGTTKEGLSYQYFSDFSAALGETQLGQSGWSISCPKDQDGQD